MDWWQHVLDCACAFCLPRVHCSSTAKMEINKAARSNPIIQDVKDGKLRDYPFPSVVNYGAAPRTYEHPFIIDELTGLLGDGDPVDVLDISSTSAVSGSVYWVRVLGALAMEDDIAADWKIIVVHTKDPLARVLTGV